MCEYVDNPSCFITIPFIEAFCNDAEAGYNV